ncbi:magnesium/cobalt transporter CorA [Flavobacteriaceae bacterium TP-CH-4]|uniref:Magnesium transport protein CorA n=1 Tax=Pelagihabitans pacificus TaxID=2696054 RepID=A0A967AVX2_9FLAO|nr:magnesium/cobalt transporter CorA [Pelagihabitans pacificus]NHF60130.1 magnesium/cobalt transporter CorA [Pelagihabitans pacificus]
MATNKKKQPSVKKKNSRARRKIGKAPGTITYLGKREKTASVLKVIEYDEQKLEEFETSDVDALASFRAGPCTSWIDVVGINDESFIEHLGKVFGLNPLLLEDAVNTEQRPKIDDYGDYLFGVFKMLYLDEQKNIVSEHVALVLFENTVILFQELEEDVFSGVRNRLRAKTGRIRARGADYLFFALIDSIIDHYFEILESINAKIEILEEEVYQDPTPEVAHRIQDLKKEVLKVRKWIFPMRELVGRLLDSESKLISKDTQPFLRDALDHCVEINESLQIYREMSMSLMEMYMSNMSNKMNEVMKVLTIMASIFIPLTFIAGIYGMNFKNMPELNTEYGYYVVWGLMIVLFIGMLFYFKRKQWL